MCIEFHNFTQLIHHTLVHTDLQLYVLITDIKKLSAILAKCVQNSDL